MSLLPREQAASDDRPRYHVVVRYIMQDDPRQATLTNKLIESLSRESPGYISFICLAEIYGVLDHSYKLTKPQIKEAVPSILTSESLLVENKELVGRAFYSYTFGNADFDDCLIAQCAIAVGCSSTVTFDKLAAKSAGMQLLY